VSAVRTAWLAAAALLAACGQTEQRGWSGYAEGDYLYVAAPLAGTLTRLHVESGRSVQRDQPLFELESESERAAREEAQARLAGAQSQAENTEKGKREPEIAVLRAQLEQARALAALAQRELARRRELVDRGFVSKAQLDEVRTTSDQAQARVRELTSTIAVARLPARRDEQAAADAQVEAARQALRQSEWRIRQKVQAAPAEGVVSDVFFRSGEFVPAGQPVIALLPPAQLKARFYVPEAELASIALGQPVRLSCDGCGDAMAARVSFISTKPEYTPPVIYSNSQRSKLVFLVEAVPDAASAARLHPGQPLDVRPAAARP